MVSCRGGLFEGVLDASRRPTPARRPVRCGGGRGAFVVDGGVGGIVKRADLVWSGGGNSPLR